MDQRLLEASQTGNTELLHHLLANDPMILHRVSLSSAENPLHVASISGHVSFAVEILRLKPDFAAQINEEGFSPMHMASANGHVAIVRELAKVDRRLSRIPAAGRSEWTPLHFAAGRGWPEVVREILSACPESIDDVTVEGESAVHVAVKNGQLESVGLMLTWMRERNKEEMVLSMRDELGNSVLHIATWKKNRQVLEWLLENEKIARATINSKNKSGLTALDTLYLFPSEAGEREIEALLRRAGAHSLDRNAGEAAPSSSSKSKDSLSTDTADEVVEYFKFKKERDTASDARTALLVMAVLVATATFQVGINPPGGVWQDSDPDGDKASNLPAHLAGKSIMGSFSSSTQLVFVIFNSMGLSVSLYMLAVLTTDFPMRLEFQICIIALYVTYFTGLGFMAHDGSSQVFVAVFSAVVPATIFSVIRLLRRLLRSLRWVVKLLCDSLFSRC